MPGAARAAGLHLGAWVTYWDFDRGQQRLASAPTLFDDVLFFSFALGSDGRPAAARPTQSLAPAVAAVKARGAKAWMTVVNDTLEAPGKVTLKDAGTT